MNTEQRRRERLDRGIKIRTDGLYALMSWRELSYLTVPRLVLIVGMLALPFIVPGMYVLVASRQTQRELEASAAARA